MAYAGLLILMPTDLYRGEGCGAVLLKPLSKAIRDGDAIYALIDATAMNNDGHTMGITTPNPAAQADVIRKALSISRIDPSGISYMEAHGTGTMIGDPIELKSLTKVFREFTDERQFCPIGSVKTNIGHLLSAAGIASLIKVILSVIHRKIPPTLNCKTPNPRFEFEDSPFYPAVRAVEWNPKSDVRRAGINSFGFGGTNVHIILAEADKDLPDDYRQVRSPLGEEKYNRKRYWLEKNVLAQEAESHAEEDELSGLLMLVKESP